MTPMPPPAPVLSPVERVRHAYSRRAESDYVFEGIGTNVLLMVVTCGIYGYYVFYQLMRRMRDHNLRMLEELEAANELAWQQATERGLAEELRPNFERVAAHLQTLRGLSTEFRDPVIWLVIAIFTGIAVLVAFVFLDGDLIKHDTNVGAVEAELSAIYARLGYSVAAPDPNRVKEKHNYGGRIAASILTCGIYSFFWYADLMREGNHHFAHEWPWEDSLAGAVQQMTPAA
jgi:uncharacterized protein DUF4234